MTGHRVDRRLVGLALLVGADAVLADAVLADAVFGPFVDAIYLVAVATLFVVLGIPHGAFDLWIFERTYPGPRKTAFVVGYIALVILMAGLWWASPTVAFAAFIALSIHHFGEGELPDGFPRWMRLVRGGFFVGVPLLIHVDAVAPIVQSMGIALETSTTTAFIVVTSILIAQVPIILHSRWSTRRQAEELAYLATWFVTFSRLPPLVAFGLYFCLWHAIDHLEDLRRRFTPLKTLRHESGWRPTLKKWLPFALAPNVVLLVAALRPDVASTVQDYAAFALIVVASLTLPHAVLVTLMRTRRLTARALTGV